MSFSGIEELTSAAGSLRRRNITYFPVVPGRVEFAVEVRRWMMEHRPQVVAIELPLPLRSLYVRAIARFPEISVIRFPDPLDPSQRVYIPVEPTDPFIEALRTAGELGIRVEFMEPNWGDRPHLGDAYPDSYAIQMIGRERYVNSYRLQKHEPTEEMVEYTAAMARKLQGLDPEREAMAIVSLNVLDLLLDLMETPQERPVEPRGRAYQAELCNAHPDCLAEITVEFPFLIERYQRYRSETIPGLRLLDRLAVQLAVLEAADVENWRASGEQMQAWQYRQIAKFAGNLAHSSGELAADIVDLTLAARGVAGDEYAWHVWTTLNRYPLQRIECEYPTIKVASEEIWCRKRRLRLRRRLPRLRVPKRTIVEDTLVAIYDEDREGLRFPLKSVEGDRASYSNADGRCGGLLTGCPIDHDVWSDSRYDCALTSGERLLLAALHNTAGRKVVHIAAKAPRRLLRDIAGHLGRQIVHIPIGQMRRSGEDRGNETIHRMRLGLTSRLEAMFAEGLRCHRPDRGELHTSQASRLENGQQVRHGR
jgi:hypothetical protein